MEDDAPASGSDRSEAAAVNGSRGVGNSTPSSRHVSSSGSADALVDGSGSGAETTTPTTPNTSAVRGRKRSRKEGLSQFEHEVLECFKNAKQTNSNDPDECDHFGRDAACTLRRLSAEKRLKVKIGFWKLVHEIEYGE